MVTGRLQIAITIKYFYNVDKREKLKQFNNIFVIKTIVQNLIICLLNDVSQFFVKRNFNKIELINNVFKILFLIISNSPTALHWCRKLCHKNKIQLKLFEKIFEV